MTRSFSPTRAERRAAGPALEITNFGDTHRVIKVWLGSGQDGS